MKRQLVLPLLLLGLVAACDTGNPISPIGPSEIAADPAVAQEVLGQWSPYVGVHVAGQARNAYGDALFRLRAAGRLRGVRVELTPSLSPSDPTYRTIAGAGADVLALVSNEYLFSNDIERDIDILFASYPEIRYFQIGNEVTTILPSTGPTLTIQEYMAIFQRIYDHVQQHHRGRAILLTQSTLGTGLHGPTELETMSTLGLTQMDPAHVIIAANSYDLDHANQYLGLLGGPLRPFRVWVTETGVRDPNLHLSWVRDNYPRLRNLLRAERIYWYIMWGGDSGTDTDFSLIRNPSSHPNYWRSPLFDLLVGG